MILTRICPMCDTPKSVEDFHMNRGTASTMAHYCKDCTKEKNSTDEKRKLQRKQYQESNKDLINARYKKWIIDNKEWVTERNRDYRIRNRDRLNKASRDYSKKRRELDLDFKLRSNLRCRIYQALNGVGRAESTLDLVGCEIDQLKTYIEELFTEGMSWENHGVHGWHIDHIIPCSSFDLTNNIQQRECFHYSNMQPLWAEDNWSKGSKCINNNSVSLYKS